MESFNRMYECQTNVSKSCSEVGFSGLDDVASIILGKRLIRDFVNKRGFLFLLCYMDGWFTMYQDLVGGSMSYTFKSRAKELNSSNRRMTHSALLFK